jgi:hypothetical protein
MVNASLSSTRIFSASRLVIVAIALSLGVWRYFQVSVSITPTILPLSEFFGIIFGSTLVLGGVDVNRTSKLVWHLLCAVIYVGLFVYSRIAAHALVHSTSPKTILEYATFVLLFLVLALYWVLFAPGSRWPAHPRHRVLLLVAIPFGLLATWDMVEMCKFCLGLRNLSSQSSFHKFVKAGLQLSLIIYSLAIVRMAVPQERTEVNSPADGARLQL